MAIALANGGDNVDNIPQNSDVIYFKASGSGEVKDMWSNGGSYEFENDLFQSLSEVSITQDDGWYHFVAYRAATSNDPFRDTNIVCGQDYDWSWHNLSTSAELL